MGVDIVVKVLRQLGRRNKLNTGKEKLAAGTHDGTEIETPGIVRIPAWQ
jgi:hypothetical protein